MKERFICGLFLLLASCSKNSDANQTPGPDTPFITIPDTLMIPLNDLGTNKYRGYTGGLYPGGVNEPFGTYATDLMVMSESIEPIDLEGNPDPNGSIVFISMGASTGGKNMEALISKTVNHANTNPHLFLLNCNQGAGGAALFNMANPLDPYWLRVEFTIANKTSFEQVQLVYLETDEPTLVTFPGKPLEVKAALQSALRVMKLKFPNLKIVYVLGRTRTFPGVKEWNIEPGPYYFGWACKWAIEDQMNGVAGFNYKGDNPEVPMLAWGFYQWADSLPRKTDGFFWRSYLTSDALHATEEGQDTLSGRFQRFLLTDPYARKWYARN